MVQTQLVHALVPRTGIISLAGLKLLEETNHTRSAKPVTKGLKAFTVNLI
jgi:hypothetical protein